MIDFISRLDTATLQFATAVVMVLTLLVALVLWRASEAESYARCWAAGYAMICVGLILGALRDHIPALLAIVLGNALLGMGAVMIGNGVALFCRGRGSWPVWPLGLAIVLAFGVFTYFYPALRVRIVLIALVFAAVCLRMAWLLWFDAPADMRIVQWPLAVLIGIEFLLFLVHASTVLVPAAAEQYRDAPVVYNAVYLNALVAFICLLFGFTGLANRRLQLTLEHTAHHDALTGALNRHALDAMLFSAGESQELAPLSVVMLDLDHFKQLNDRFGHQAGDEALRLFADAARRHLRQSDTLGRTGGEEFCLVLPRTDSEAACTIAERLRQLIEDIIIPAAPAARLTVSAGVATTSGVRPADREALLKAADEALYAAKRAGRNRVVAAQIDSEHSL